MKKTYNFYCDESTHLPNDGMPYMLIAYISSPYHQIALHKKHIANLKKAHNFKGEIKWSNVSNAKYNFYKELIEYFFATDLWFRAVIIDKSQIKASNQEEFDDFYFKMYYQLLHHKIDMGSNYNIYIDIKDTRSHIKTNELRKILSHNSSIKRLQTIRSYESGLLQLTDLIMGAINYKLRGLDKVTAKNSLIKILEKSFGRSLQRTTPKNLDKLNLFFIDLK